MPTIEESTVYQLIHEATALSEDGEPRIVDAGELVRVPDPAPGQPPDQIVEVTLHTNPRKIRKFKVDRKNLDIPTFRDTRGACAV